jgi:hypothetical protein
MVQMIDAIFQQIHEPFSTNDCVLESIAAYISDHHYSNEKKWKMKMFLYGKAFINSYSAINNNFSYLHRPFNSSSACLFTTIEVTYSPDSFIICKPIFKKFSWRFYILRDFLSPKASRCCLLC